MCCLAKLRRKVLTINKNKNSNPKQTHTLFITIIIHKLHYCRMSTWNAKESNGDRAASLAMHAGPLHEKMRLCACARVQVCVLAL